MYPIPVSCTLHPIPYTLDPIPCTVYLPLYTCLCIPVFVHLSLYTCLLLNPIHLFKSLTNRLTSLSSFDYIQSLRISYYNPVCTKFNFPKLGKPQQKHAYLLISSAKVRLHLRERLVSGAFRAFRISICIQK